MRVIALILVSTFMVIQPGYSRTVQTQTRCSTDADCSSYQGARCNANRFCEQTIQDVRTAPPPQCMRDDDCQDATFCNGREHCQPGTRGADARGCIVAPQPACLAGQQCDESTRRCYDARCEGSSGDADGDGVMSTACGGTDCDDSDPARYPGGSEVCDNNGHDEDCDPQTFGNRDRDGDGYIDAQCYNMRPY